MARKGQPTSDETKAKMRASHLRRRGIGPDNPDPPRFCKRCQRTLPARLFVRVRETPHGTIHRRGPCQDCREQERRAAGIPKRHVRINAAGDVWCNNCQRYLPTTSFKRHPLRPHTFWAYCVECTREMDRMRWRGERRDRHNSKRPIAKKKRQTADRAERRDFVKGAILTLRKRGLTKSDICRLVDTSFSSLLVWERGERRVTRNASERFGIALLETSHLLTGRKPAYRRRMPLPGFDELVARVRPLMDVYPLRSRWKGRDS